MDLDIRPVSASEYDALGALTAQAYLQGGLLDFGEQDPYLPKLRDVARRAATAEVLVAVGDPLPGDDDEAGERAPGPRLLGGITFVPGPGPMADMARDGEAEIRTLAVAPEARGRGVGEALTRACLDRARAAGFRNVVLCSQTRMHAAHRLYRRLGFTRVPDRDWSPAEKLDTQLLAYTLDLTGGQN
ncbi:GNAT family N-acetyltransferase [Myceligenerans crystallogenes]|uniref:GNAT family N-acetyltransferase n=1 Tax=Myceligenerans crystallogenes TaxID=316335 RepID=A0ABP4ZJQ2_9MICO